MKIEELSKEEKEYFKVEIEAFKNGQIEEEFLDALINRGRKVKENFENKQKKEKVTNLIKLLQKKPHLLTNFSKFIEYRRLRVEQVIYGKLIEDAKNSYGDDAGELNIGRMQESLYSLDRHRREYHNTALSNFNALVNECYRNNIPPIYTGKLMDPYKEKDKYGDHRVREEMTDGMLYILDAIENIRINELEIDTKNYNDALGTFSEIHNSLNKQTRGYGLKKNLDRDDGDIEL